LKRLGASPDHNTRKGTKGAADEESEQNPKDDLEDEMRHG